MMQNKDGPCDELLKLAATWKRNGKSEELHKHMPRKPVLVQPVNKQWVADHFKYKQK